jgi:hypothetical protein
MEFQEKVDCIVTALEKEIAVNGNQVLKVDKKSPKAKRQGNDEDISDPFDKEVTEPAHIEPTAKDQPHELDEDIFSYSSNEDERPSPVGSVDQSGYNMTTYQDMSLCLDEESNEPKTSKKEKKNKEKQHKEEKKEKKRKHDGVEKVKEKKHKKHKKHHQDS